MSNPDPTSSENASTEPTPRGRRIWRKLLLSLTSLVVTLAGVELILRSTGFSYELRAGILYLDKLDRPLPTFEGCTIDRDYFWKSKLYDKQLERAFDNRPDVLFMGDSCTELGRYDLYFAELMHQADKDRPLVTAKLGVTGWSTYQGLQQLEKDVARIRPRVTTFYYGWNDHWLNIGLTDAEVGRLKASPLYWFQPLRVGQLVLKAYIGYHARQHGGLAARQPDTLRVPPAVFRENLIKLVEKARELEITPILITAPSAHEPGREPPIMKGRWVADLDDLIPLHQQYVEIVREVARDRDVVLCDLAAAFDELPREQVREAMFQNDGIHLREPGDRLIARLLVEAYLELDLQ